MQKALSTATKAAEKLLSLMKTHETPNHTRVIARNDKSLIDVLKKH
jgi:hypothetical protein